MYVISCTSYFASPVLALLPNTSSQFTLLCIICLVSTVVTDVIYITQTL